MTRGVLAGYSNQSIWCPYKQCKHILKYGFCDAHSLRVALACPFFWCWLCSKTQTWQALHATVPHGRRLLLRPLAGFILQQLQPDLGSAAADFVVVESF